MEVDTNISQYIHNLVEDARSEPDFSNLRCRPSIQLVSGDYFSFAEIESSPVYPEDIAHALAKVCRFAGHVVGDFTYSTAQHCVLGSRYIDPVFAFEFLLHDASEYVLGDVSTPLKQLLPQYKTLEKRVEKRIAREFGLPHPMSPEIKVVDLKMLATEARDLMPSTDYTLLKGVEPYPDKIKMWSPAFARDQWLKRFYELAPSWYRFKSAVEHQSTQENT